MASSLASGWRFVESASGVGPERARIGSPRWLSFAQVSRNSQVAALKPRRGRSRLVLSMKVAIANQRPTQEPAPAAAEHIAPRASDLELVERLARGDQWAKEALYRRYVKLVWSTALHLVRNRADAQDVVQDTFVEALRDLGGLRVSGALRPWLLRITVHQAHRRFRRRKLLRRLGLHRSIDDAPLESLLHPGASPEVLGELRVIDRALYRGGDADRCAWLLRYVDGYTLEEVADACACSLATAKRRLSRAHALVQSALADEVAVD